MNYIKKEKLIKKKIHIFVVVANLINISREREGRREKKKSDISILSISGISSEMSGRFVSVSGLRGRTR